MFCDIAFMGGGVRGGAFAGAINRLEKSGYIPRKVAGTSAGAIVAALVAAEFSSDEMRKELESLDYLKFKTKDYRSFGLISDIRNLRNDYGIYSADYFEEWISGLLKQKGKTTFSDIEHGKLQLTASDVQNKRLLVLPQDLKIFGLNPQTFSIAKAVRMSMSIPLFYEPYRLIDSVGDEHLIVDGGLFDNYPIWLLDNGCFRTDVPVFGMKFVECKDSFKNDINRDLYKLSNYVKLVISSVLDSKDQGYSRITKGDAERTINISVCVNNTNIHATDFDIDKKTAVSLFNNGYDAVTDFLKNWNFEKWLNLR